MVPVSFDLAAIFRPIRSRSSLFLLLFFLFLYSICLVSFLFLCVVVVVVNLTTLINNDRKMSCSSFFFSKILLFLCTSVLQEDDVDSWGDVGVCVSSGFSYRMFNIFKAQQIQARNKIKYKFPQNVIK